MGEAKYAVGDRVWLALGGRVTVGTIAAVQSKCSDGFTSTQYYTVNYASTAFVAEDDVVAAPAVSA